MGGDGDTRKLPMKAEDESTLLRMQSRESQR